jgi:hypothetical protein
MNIQITFLKQVKSLLIAKTHVSYNLINRGFLYFILFLIQISAYSQTTIVQWNFNSNPPDATTNTATGTTAPSTGSGLGSISTFGGTAGAFLGGSSNDPLTDNSGWDITTFPANSGAPGNNKTAGIEISVNTTGKKDIILTFDQRNANSASNKQTIQYSSDGTTFTDFTTIFNYATTDAAKFVSRTVNLSTIAVLNNNPNVKIRILSTIGGDATSTTTITKYAGTSTGTQAGYGGGGSWRFDMVTVTGSPTCTITLAAGTATNPTTCTGSDGSIPFSTSNLLGLYNLNFKKGTADQTVPITVASDNTFTLSGLTAGSYSAFSITDAGCTASDGSTKELMDPSVATPSITGLAANYCKNEPAVTLMGTPSGGTFTIESTTTTPPKPLTTVSIFDPAALANGLYSVVYTISENGCTAAATQSARVRAAPTTPSITGLNSAYCKDASAFTLTGSTPQTGGSGVFTIDGTTAATFDPSVLTVGPHTVSYTVSNTNCSSSVSQTVQVIAVPDKPTISALAANYCQNEAPVTLTGLPSGGVFTIDGVIATSLNPSVLTVGMHTVDYTINVDGCTAFSSQSVEVKAISTPTITSLAANYCKNEPAVTLTGTPSGGTFTIESTTTTPPKPLTTVSIFDPAALANGLYSVVYTISENGCTAAATQSARVRAAPTTPSITGLNSAYCKDASAFTLTGSTPQTGGSGVFTIDGTTAATFDPSVLTVGPHTVSYTVSNTNCSSSVSQTVQVKVVPPTPAITGLAAAYCKNEAAITLTGTPMGGTFTIDGTVATTFDPSVLPAGIHIVVYTINLNGCPASISQSVEIKSISTPTITGLAANYCKNEPAITLTGTPSGGTFTIDGVTATIFDPAALTATNHTVVYTISENGCSAAATQPARVRAAPTTPSITGLAAAYCKDASAFTLTGSTPPTGGSGTFTIDGVIATIFDPAALITGNHIVVYSVVNANCSNSVSQSVEVKALPTTTTPAITGLAAAYCQNDLAVTLAGLPTGGMFTIDGTTATSLNPSVLTAGNHTIAYTITINGCSASTSQSVEVKAISTPAITGLAANYCKNEPTVTLTGTPSGGSFTIDGVAATDFDPAALSVANHTVVYTISENGCSAAATQSARVRAAPTTPSITGLAAAYCKDAAPVTLNGSIPPTGGSSAFTIDGVTATIFDPAALSVGNHTVTYTVSNTNCSKFIDQTVEVKAVPVTPTINGLAAAYCKNEAVVTLLGSPTGGVFTIDGTTATSLNPSVLTVGNHTIAYTITINGCSASTSQSVEVKAISTPVIIGLAATYCKNEPAITLMGTPSGGSFTIDGTLATTFNPSVLSVGNHTVIYNITVNGCSAFSSQSVDVIDIATPAITGLATAYCKNDPALTLTGTPTGGSFTIDGVAATTFDPTLLSVANHVVVYTILQNGCKASVTQSSRVRNAPTPPTITGLAAAYCKDAAAVTLTGSNPPTGGSSAFTIDGVTATIFDPAALSVGNHNVVYTVSNTNCSNFISQMVEVKAVPTTPTITSLAAAYCKNEAAVTLVGSPSGGVFTIDGTVATTLDPSVLSVGRHTVTYTITINGCSAFSSQSVDVIAEPNATITNLETNYCIDAPAVTLTATTPGGIFTINGVVATKFDPVILGAATHTVTYTVTVNGCTGSTTKTVRVRALPNPRITGLAASYCQNNEAITLVGTPIGGNFTINGTTATAFDPSVLAVGNHTVVYSVTVNGCSNSISETVEVKLIPVLSFATVNLCGSGTTGQISLTVTSASSTNLTNNWSGPTGFTGSTTSIIQTTIPGNYTVVVRDNSNRCSTTETVVLSKIPDITPPTAKCKDINIQIGFSGIATITPQDIDDGSSDNCAIKSIELNKSSFNSGGAFDIILTAKDYDNNQSTCISKVKVRGLFDNVPYIICPSEQVLNFAELQYGVVKPTSVSVSNGEVATSIKYEDKVYQLDCNAQTLPSGLPIEASSTKAVSVGACQIVVRRFTANFGGVFTSTCSQVFYITPTNLDDVVVPEPARAACLNDVLITTPNITGYPRYPNGLDILDFLYCTSATYTDGDIVNNRFTRRWTVANRCGSSRVFTQRINLPRCGTPQVSISGGIKRETGENIDANVKIFSQQTQIAEVLNTNFYTFSNLPIEQNYIIRPDRNDDVYNGVTTYDIALISQHILDIKTLSSPYQMIAADVNRDGLIDAKDMITIRNLVLRRISAFPSNTSWRFIPKRYVFTNPLNPFSEDFPELLAYNNLNDTIKNADFIAIKTGDINLSARNNVNTNTLLVRNNRPIENVYVEDKLLEKGKEYTLDFSIKNKDLVALQMILNINPSLVEAFSISKGDLPNFDTNNMSIDETKGIMALAWAKASKSNLHNENIVFSLRLKPKQTAYVHDIIKCDEQNTDNLAYNTEGGIEKQINLYFNKGSNNNSTQEFKLLQNYPNPFSHETTIAFILPEDNTAQLTIFDINGREVFTLKKGFKSGYNEISISKNALKQSGVYIYRLQTDKYSVSKRMQIFTE